MSSFNPLIFEKMSEQYKSLLDSGNRSDVVLVAGDKELSVHKLVLSARSPVFAAMFAHASTKEAQENRVEIIDVDVEVLELMIRYIYTGKVDMLDRYAADLLAVADKYQLDSLKSICEQELLSLVITNDSVLDLLILADMHQATELTSKCLDYITDNGTQVRALDGWKKLRVKPDLLDKLFELSNLKYSNVINGNCEKKVKMSPHFAMPFKMASFDSLIFEEMAKHYESLLKNAIRSDVVLFAGDKDLCAHKLVLAARSPVFAFMFADDSTNETQENRVEIIDLNVEVLELLVRYIYTGKVEKLDQYAADLFVAADKYQLDCLKLICEKRLLSQITTESVSDLLIFADKYQVTQLITNCLDYITFNGTQVMASEGWKQIVLRADLLAKLFELLNLKYSKVVDDNIDLKEKVEFGRPTEDWEISVNDFDDYDEPTELDYQLDYLASL